MSPWVILLISHSFGWDKQWYLSAKLKNLEFSSARTERCRRAGRRSRGLRQTEGTAHALSTHHPGITGMGGRKQTVSLTVRFVSQPMGTGGENRSQSIEQRRLTASVASASRPSICDDVRGGGGCGWCKKCTILERDHSQLTT
jgi:hypothetical protein